MDAQSQQAQSVRSQHPFSYRNALATMAQNQPSGGAPEPSRSPNSKHKKHRGGGMQRKSHSGVMGETKRSKGRRKKGRDVGKSMKGSRGGGGRDVSARSTSSTRSSKTEKGTRSTRRGRDNDALPDCRPSSKHGSRKGRAAGAGGYDAAHGQQQGWVENGVSVKLKRRGGKGGKAKQPHHQNASYGAYGHGGHSSHGIGIGGMAPGSGAYVTQKKSKKGYRREAKQNSWGMDPHAGHGADEGKGRSRGGGAGGGGPRGFVAGVRSSVRGAPADNGYHGGAHGKAFQQRHPQQRHPQQQHHRNGGQAHHTGHHNSGSVL